MTTEFAADKDPYRLWERLIGDDLTGDFAHVASIYWGCQTKYNATSRVACEGMSRLRPGGKTFRPRYCGSILCPGCWHKIQLNILHGIEQVPAPHWHVRATNALPTNQYLDPRVLKRFRARSSRFSLVGWMISCEESEGFEADGYGGTEYRPPTVFYRYVGLFTSEQPVRDYAVGIDSLTGERIPGLMYSDPSKKNIIGSVDLHSYDNVYEAIDKWAELTPHPAPILDHESIAGYQDFFSTLGHQHHVAHSGYVART